MKVLRLSAWLVLLPAILVVSGCWQKQAPTVVLARVNGEVLTRFDLELERSFHQMGPAGTEKNKKKDVSDETLLQGLMDQLLVEQRARTLELSVPDREIEDTVRFHSLGAAPRDFEKALKEHGIKLGQWKERLRQQALAEELFHRENDERVVITDAEIRDYYWEHVTRYRRPQRIKLRHIVCKTSEQADAAMGELLLGDPFDEVVRRYSQGPEASKGGLIGWVRSKDLPSEIKRTAFKLKKMVLSDVVRSKHGWHILRVDKKEKARNLSVEEATPLVRGRLKIEKEQSLYRDWLFGLRRRAVIELVAENGNGGARRKE
jgi:peptidyl-prolyl cis-trans isomerase SurA